MEKKLLALIVVFLFFCTSVSLSVGGIEYPSIANDIDTLDLTDKNPVVSTDCSTNDRSFLIIDEHFEGTWVESDDPDDPFDYEVPVHPIYGEWDIDGLCSQYGGTGYPELGPGIHKMADYGGDGLPYDGDYCAGAWWAGGTNDVQDEWLKTPEMNLSYFSDLQLSFYGIWCWDSIYNDHVYIKISTDNETTWNVLADLLQDPEYEVGTGGPVGNGWCWNEYQVVINLSAYDHEPSVIIAYHLKGDPTMGAVNFIDAFVLLGSLNESPVVDFTIEPTHPVAGDTVFFNSTSYDTDGSIVNWSWDFGDGQVAAGEQQTHQYAENGTYTVTLYVTDNDLNTVSKVKDVNIGCLNVALKQGWNLISLPSNLTMDKTNFIVRYNATDYTWTEAISNLSLINEYIFGWSSASQQYGFANQLESGCGYWLYAYVDCELRLDDIALPPEDSFITNLDNGWNLVGMPFAQPIGKLFLKVNDTQWNIAVTSGMISDYVFGWDQIGQSYGFYDTFHPGQGYWLYVYQPCVLKRFS